MRSEKVVFGTNKRQWLSIVVKGRYGSLQTPGTVVFTTVNEYSKEAMALSKKKGAGRESSN